MRKAETARFRSMPTTLRSLALAFLLAGVSACSKDSNAPDASTNLSGHWVSSDTVDVFTSFDLLMTQSENGIIKGNWVGTTLITNGKCDLTFGCAPKNIVTGTNLSLRVDIEILGAGSFTGQLATKELIQGQIIRLGQTYNLKLRKTN
jgi:hypothetical protein